MPPQQQLKSTRTRDTTRLRPENTHKAMTNRCVTPSTCMRGEDTPKKEEGKFPPRQKTKVLLIATFSCSPPSAGVWLKRRSSCRSSSCMHPTHVTEVRVFNVRLDERIMLARESEQIFIFRLRAALKQRLNFFLVLTQSCEHT